MKNILKKMSLFLPLLLQTDVFAAPNMEAKTIIGDESRIRFSSNSYPWTAYGIVNFGQEPQWSCTGTLVGPRHVLTNAHCVDRSYPIYFYPSYNNGDYLNKQAKKTKAIQIYAGTKTVETSSNSSLESFSLFDDWAILVLDQDVGKTFGWIDVKPWDDTFLNSTYVHSFGYPAAGNLNENGRYPLLQKQCSIRGISLDYLQHDCDTNSGSSGSSLVTNIDQKYYIIGLHNTGAASSNSERCAPFQLYYCSNGAVKTDKFIPTLKRALADYP